MNEKLFYDLAILQISDKEHLRLALTLFFKKRQVERVLSCNNCNLRALPADGVFCVTNNMIYRSRSIFTN